MKFIKRRFLIYSIDSNFETRIAIITLRGRGQNGSFTVTMSIDEPMFQDMKHGDSWDITMEKTYQ